MVICKICNPTLEGNGYCAEHSTSGSSCLIDTRTKWQKMTLWEKIKATLKAEIKVIINIEI